MEAALVPLHQSEQTLGDRLRELELEDGETQADFLGRAALLAGEYPDRKLTPDDLEAAQLLLPIWRFNNGRLDSEDLTKVGEGWGIARRAGRVILGEQHTGFDENRRRLVGMSGDSTLVVAKEALLGDDLASIFKIEKENVERFAVHGPRSNGKPLGLRRGRKLPEPELFKESEGPSKLRLTNGQKNVLWLAAVTRAKAANMLNVSIETIATRMSKALDENDMSREELLTIAVEEGRIDMSLLPERQKYTLTALEQKMAKDYMFSSKHEAMKGLEKDGFKKMGSRTLGEAWTGIYQKIGIDHPSSRTRAFLVLKRDGVL